MGQHPRIVPWSSWEEWIFVKNGLYSNSVDSQRMAIEIINMWKVRGRIPLSVESTANLVEITINDADPATGYIATNLRSESELRMMYSIGVVRAVNSLVDPSQQGYFADSIYTIAAKIGLPGWFVELRHDATHNQFPSISLLRSAARGLLAWYRDNYWGAQLLSLEALHRRCIEESTSLNREKSFTFESAIFLPMFVDALLQSTPPIIPATCTSATAAAIRTKAYETLVSFWMPKIDDIKLSPEVAICHLLSKAVDVALRLSDEEYDWQQYVIISWIELFCKRKKSLSDSENSGTEMTIVNRYILSIRDICGAMTPIQKQWMQSLDTLLLANGVLPMLVEDSTTHVLGKRKISPNECIVEEQRFKQLGITQHTFGCDDLYLIEEVSSQLFG